MSSLGRMLIIIGAVCIVLGIVFLLLPRIPFPGKLPGDIVVRKEKYVFYFPLMSSIIISIIVSILLWIFRK